MDELLKAVLCDSPKRDLCRVIKHGKVEATEFPSMNQMLASKKHVAAHKSSMIYYHERLSL